MSSNARPWDAYLALSDEERASPARIEAVVPVLLQSLQQAGVEPPAEVRRRLLSALLNSLSPSPSSAALKTHSTTLNPASPASVLLPTLSLVKHLGRSPAGSEELARERGLTILLAYGGLARAATALPPPPPRAPAQRRTDPESGGLGIIELDSDDDDDDGGAAKTADEPDPLSMAESEALRCLCNTLTLHPAARELFPTVVLEDRAWVQGMVRLLTVQGAAFLAGRLLFLLTSKPGDMVTELTEKGDAVDALAYYSTRYVAKLKSSSASALSSGPAPTPADILREHFKFAYNLMLQYSRQPNRPPASRDSDENVVGQSSLSPPSGEHDDDDRSDISDAHTDELGGGGGSGSGSRPSSPLPGTPAAATAAAKGKKRFWGSKQPPKDDESNPPSPTPSEPRRSKSPRLLAKRIKSAVIGAATSKSTSPSSTSVPPLPTPADGAPTGELSLPAASHFLPLFHPYLSLACLLPLNGPSNPDPKDPSPLVRSALNTLLNFPIQLEELDGYLYSWLQPVPGAQLAFPSLGAPLPSRLLELLAKTCDAWFPTDKLPKDKKARQTLPAHPDDLIPKGTGESGRAEEILGPLMLLLRKVSMLSEPAFTIKALLLPDDLDRTVVLEQRTDLTGHLVRLMSSILLPNTAYGVGEFLYNLCDRDPTTFSTTLGYGNVAGFLQNRGELIPPPAMPTPRTSTSSTTITPSTSTATSSSKKTTTTAPPPRPPVNPITGAYEVPKSGDEPQLTEEEKEREAERLYVLFDRMAKTGVMDVENPIQKARTEGRFSETNDERERELARVKEEEEREEKEVEEELKRYKARKQRVPV